MSPKNLFGFFFINRPPEPLYPTIKIRHPDAEFLIDVPQGSHALHVAR